MPTVQRLQLDEKGERVQLAAETLHQIGGRSGGATGCQQIIDNQHPLPFSHRVGVDLERVGAIFKRIRLPHGRERQLAGLSDRSEARADSIRDRRAENEPAALDADDDVDPLILKWERKAVDGRAESCRLLQQRRDVVEQDSSLRKIWYVTNLCFEMVHV